MKALFSSLASRALRRFGMAKHARQEPRREIFSSMSAPSASIRSTTFSSRAKDRA